MQLGFCNRFQHQLLMIERQIQGSLAACYFARHSVEGKGTGSLLNLQSR